MSRKLVCLALGVLAVGLAQTGRGQDADPNLVGWWRFEEASGTLYDQSDNHNDGTAVNGVLYQQPGQVGYALGFDGVDDYVVVGSAGRPTDTFSFGGWIRTSATHEIESESISSTGGVAGQRYAFDPQHGGDFDGGAGLSVGTNGIAVYEHGSNYMPATAVYATEIGDDWNHIMIVYSNKRPTIYLNGLAVRTGLTSPRGVVNAPVQFGGMAYGYLEGYMDEIRIYSRALTAAEIEEMAFRPKARGPDPADGAEGVDTPLLQWTAGDSAVAHKLYFSTDPDNLTFIGEMSWTVYWHAAGIDPGVTYYWRVDEVEPNDFTHVGDVWSFTATPLNAWKPNPADGATDVMITTKLSWNKGMSAGPLRHRVFFGTDAAAVADGTGDTDKGILDDPTYDPGPLKADTVYYFRVNEVESDGTEREGDIWSFETVPAGPGRIMRQWWLGMTGTALATMTGNADYPDNPDGSEWVDLFEGPVDWADHYGSRLSGWLFPPATGDYTFWIATDDPGQCWLSTDEDPANAVMICEVTGWVPSRDFDDNTGTGGGAAIMRSAPISLEAGRRYFIEAIMKEHEGGDNIAVAWQGPGIPVRAVISAEYVGATPDLPERAYSPSPGDGSTGVPDTVILAWQAGAKAIQHEVYLGTEEAAVAAADATTPGIYRGLVTTTSYVPSESLEWGRVYYWKVNEKNNDGTTSVGRVWSLTVADYIVVDDFEDYNDYSPHRIFQTWLDGWGYTDPAPGKTGNGTGSTVGYLSPPFAEQTTVHGGGQSMPFGYDNSGAAGKARYSEAEREFPVAQNFSRKGVKSMSLWVYGDPCSVPATVYVGLQDSTGTRVDVPETNANLVAMSGWHEINIELSKFSPVNLNSIRKIYLGVGNRLSPVPGPTGDLFIDDIRLYGPRCVPSELKPANDLNDDCVVDYLDLEIVANQWLTTGHLVTPSNPGTAGLIAYYPLDGNVNDTVGGHNGAPNGGPTYGPGRVGQALRLDGVNDYVVVGSVGIAGDVARTICCWAKADSTAIADWTNIFGFVGPAADPRTDMSFDFQIVGDTGTTTQGWLGIHVYGWEHDIVANDLDWHHLAASYDGTTVRAYGDGMLTGTGDRTLATNDNVHMGKRSDYDNYFPGSVDEARIFNRVLSAAEIAYLAGVTVPFSAAFDLNADDTVDFMDVGVLGGAWLEELLWPAGP